MLSVKQSTQTWSKAPQQSSLKADLNETVSPEEYKKAFGDKDIGEVLNQVADPNWVDPAKTRRVGNNELDRDAFLKLLLAQLKYQDPTNPMQNHEMAAQLAQFSSLESLSNIDKGIGDLAKATAPKQDFAALNLIGKVVSGDSSRVTRVDEKERHDIVYHLMGDAREVKLKVLDDNNQSVREVLLNDVKKGRNDFSWNGITDEGHPARPGEYRVQFTAVGSNGQKIGIETQFEGKISGINFSPQGPLLMIGNQSIRLSEVKKIVDPSVSKEMKEIKEKDNRTVGGGNNNKDASHGLPVSGNNNKQNSSLGSVAMSRDMVNAMKKQGIEAGL